MSSDWELFRQAFKSGGPIAACCSLLVPHILWPVLIGSAVAAGLTVFEANFRTTTPDRFWFAVFFPAPILMWAALGSRSYMLLISATVGLTAGFFARDGGAWLTYVIPNIAQAWVFHAMAKRGLRAEGRQLDCFMTLFIALVLAVAVGAFLGGWSWYLTVTMYHGTALPWPLWQVMMQWLVGDITACGLVLFIVSARLGPTAVANHLRARTCR